MESSLAELTQTKKGPSPWFVAVVAGMASYIDSASIVGIGTTLVIYQAALGLSASQVGTLSGALTFAIAIGALVGGRAGDRFGRKVVFSITMALIVIGSVLLITCTSFGLLFVGIGLIGLGTGADLPVSLATIGEAAATSKPGRHVGLSNVLWLIGIVATQLIAMIVGDIGRAGGQILAAHVGLVAAIVLFLRIRIPESKQWLDRSKMEHGERSSSGFRLLAQKQYLLPLFGLLGFYSLTNLAANTQGQFGTYIWVNVVGQSVSFASGMSLISQVTWFLWAFVFMTFADQPTLRMRWYVVAAFIGVGGQLLPMIVGFSVPTMLVSQLAFGVFVGFAFEGIMKVWTQESFPVAARATAQGSVISIARIVAAVVASFTPAMLGTSAATMYGALAGVMAIGLAIGYVAFRRPRQNHLSSEIESGEQK
jgi:inositol transporter-like SP family MFS transporter